MHFHIKLQEADKPLLEKVKNTLNCGGVYLQNEKRNNHSLCYRYTVGSTGDILEKIIPFFQRHTLQTVSKSKSFKLFCQIAELVRENRHLDSKGIEKIRMLKSKMNQRTAGLA